MFISLNQSICSVNIHRIHCGFQIIHRIYMMEFTLNCDNDAYQISKVYPFSAIPESRDGTFYDRGRLPTMAAPMAHPTTFSLPHIDFFCRSLLRWTRSSR